MTPPPPTARSPQSMHHSLSADHLDTQHHSNPRLGLGVWPPHPTCVDLASRVLYSFVCVFFPCCHVFRVFFPLAFRNTPSLPLSETPPHTTGRPLFVCLFDSSRCSICLHFPTETFLPSHIDSLLPFTPQLCLKKTDAALSPLPSPSTPPSCPLFVVTPTPPTPAQSQYDR